MTDTLAMLSAEDWTLLRERAATEAYPAGTTLLEEGIRRRALFIVREGIVRVEQAHQGYPITLAHLGPGEVFGEMGFIEDAPASAAVVAEDDVMVDRIEDAALESLIASMPGFAIRFYQSLAIAMARRLRATSRRLAQRGVSEVSQVSRFHQPRTGNASPRQIQPALADGLAAFEGAMAQLDRQLRATTLPLDDAQARLGSACDEVLALLEASLASEPVLEMGWDDLLAFRDPSHLEAGVGDHVFRATFPVFMLSATMARCYTKPRGFPEDHETVAMIYRDEDEGDGRLGPLVDRWFLDRPFCHARRAGRAAMVAMLGALVASWAGGEPVRLASVASGTAAEVFDLYLTMPELSSRLVTTCVDLDDDALLAAAGRAERLGIGDRMTFLHGNAVPVDGEGIALRPHHVISAVGLWEYLGEDEAVAFLDWAHGHLVPGGSVVVTNLAAGNPDRALMEHLLDWRVHHRTVDDVRRLFGRSLFGAGERGLVIDDVDGQVIARCARADA
jgi:extracellular factor (EF) 3-hydroxypalmitic acid methyl ester biosynthesis protein